MPTNDDKAKVEEAKEVVEANVKVAEQVNREDPKP